MNRPPRTRTNLATRQPYHRARRRGFTLVELIVSVVLLTVGVGALAGTATHVLYETAASRRAESAAIRGRTRLEQLRLTPCTGTSGETIADGLSERWAATATGHEMHATVAISYRERGRDVTHEYATRYAC